MDMCPPDNKHRVAHISIANLVIGVPAAASPILSGWVAGNWNVPTLFTVCLGISLVALLWLAAALQRTAHRVN